MEPVYLQNLLFFSFMGHKPNTFTDPGEFGMQWWTCGAIFLSRFHLDSHNEKSTPAIPAFCVLGSRAGNRL